MIQLNTVEARVAAALVEKDRTTPDSYPLTTNSLVAACNQKTSRDPVMAVTAAEVDAALLELRQRGMVRTVRGTGERTFKHRHTLDEALHLDDQEVACLAILVLRGAQTTGELRTRSERYVSFADLDAVEATLQRLAARDEPLARNTGRGPGQSQDRWIELLSEAAEGAGGGFEGAVAPTGASTEQVRQPDTDTDTRLNELRSELEDLRALVEEIRLELGMSPDSPPDV